MDKSLMLNEIKEHLKIKKDVDFAEFLGIKQTTLSAWRSRNAFDERILYEKCKDLNYGWLMTGIGPMLNFSVIKEMEDKEVKYGKNGGTAKEIDYLKDKIMLMEMLLKEKDRTIQLLESKFGKD